MGTPQTLVGHRRMLTVNGEQVQIPALDLLYALRGKIRAYVEREAPRDIEDALWIITTFAAEVRALRASLDPVECDEFLRGVNGPEKAQVAEILGRQIS
jgi:hypothetical protein